MKVSAFADYSNNLDSGVKPQNDTQEKVHNINLNNVHKIKNIILPLSFWGLTPESR